MRQILTRPLNSDSMQKILLVMDSRRWFDREVSRGIFRYARPDRQWTFHRIPLPGKKQREFQLDWQPDGVIGVWESEATRSVFEGCPLVEVGSRLASPAEATVSVDQEEVGRRAARYFFARGYRHMAFAGNHRFHFSRRRCAGFRAAVESSGRLLHLCDVGEWTLPLPDHLVELDRWVSDWLKALPKPCAILLMNDDYGLWFTQLALEAGIRVPGEVAMLGVDNDELGCEAPFPMLSSIAIPAIEIGRAAAEMLDRLMRGEKLAMPHVSLSPGDIVSRRSTDEVGVSHPQVALFMRHVREHPAQTRDVAHAVEVLGLQRRSLERAFRKVVGRTPREDLLLARLEYATRRLCTSQETLEVIAEESGFASLSHFCGSFKAYHSMTPTAYRSSH